MDLWITSTCSEPTRRHVSQSYRFDPVSAVGLNLIIIGTIIESQVSVYNETEKTENYFALNNLIRRLSFSPPPLHHPPLRSSPPPSFFFSSFAALTSKISLSVCILRVNTKLEQLRKRVREGGRRKLIKRYVANLNQLLEEFSI